MNIMPIQQFPMKNPSLGQLEVLVGEWIITGAHPLFPGATLTGLATFKWLDGGAFLVMHSDFEKPGPPGAIGIFGHDDSFEKDFMLYFDDRGVSRIYEMRFNEGIWKMNRNYPGFSQRFTGSFSDGNKTITGIWELSKDGITWKRDLEVVYTKV
jgi:hypothetical protein